MLVIAALPNSGEQLVLVDPQSVCIDIRPVYGEVHQLEQCFQVLVVGRVVGLCHLLIPTFLPEARQFDSRPDIIVAFVEQDHPLEVFHGRPTHKLLQHHEAPVLVLYLGDGLLVAADPLREQLVVPAVLLLLGRQGVMPPNL